MIKMRKDRLNERMLNMLRYFGYGRSLVELVSIAWKICHSYDVSYSDMWMTTCNEKFVEYFCEGSFSEIFLPTYNLQWQTLGLITFIRCIDPIYRCDCKSAWPKYLYIYMYVRSSYVTFKTQFRIPPSSTEVLNERQNGLFRRKAHLPNLLQVHGRQHVL